MAAVNKKVYLSAEDFLAGITVTPEDFEGPLGLVSLRGLTTLEVNRIQREAKNDDTALFVGVIIEGMVYPKLSRDAVEKLQNGSFGKILPYAQRIQALSGLAQTDEQAENLDEPPGVGS